MATMSLPGEIAGPAEEGLRAVVVRLLVVDEQAASAVDRPAGEGARGVLDVGLV
jgi:hypothetical protein